MKMRFIPCLVVTFGVIISYLVLVSLIFKSKIHCDPFYISGETKCQKPPPVSYEYAGKLENSHRSGFGVFSTSNYQYTGQYYKDKMNGDGEVKFFSTIFDPYVSFMKGKWTDDELNDRVEFQMYFNTTLRMNYKGRAINTKADGRGGDLECYENEKLFFRSSNIQFKKGMISCPQGISGIKTPILELFSSGGTVKLEILNFESSFGITSGYKASAKFKHRFGMIDIVYGWNGKRLELISPKQEEKADGDISKPGNADFVIYMTEYPLTKSLILIREFEMNFISKELDLRSNIVSLLDDIRSLESYEDTRKREEKSEITSEGFMKA